MALRTEHKGYGISFNDVSETWYCMTLGKSNSSLAALKKQIDSYDRRLRKGAAVDAYRLESSFAGMKTDQGREVATLSPVKVVEYLGASTSRFSSDCTEVAVVPEGQSRRKVPLNSLYKVTDKNREILKRAEEKGRQALSLINQMQIILSELERLDEGSVAGLARLAEGDEI